MSKSTKPKPSLSPEASLLAAAARLFAELGYSAASTRAIATTANVNMALILYHFGGKDGLFDAVVRSWVTDLDSRLRLALHPDIQPEERLSAIVDAFLRFAIVDMPSFTSVVARELTGQTASSIAVRVHEALTPIRAHFADALVANSEQAAADPKEVMAMLLAVAVVYAAMPALNPGNLATAFNAARHRTRQLGLYSDRPTLPALPAHSPSETRYVAPALSTDDFVD